MFLRNGDVEKETGKGTERAEAVRELGRWVVGREGAKQLWRLLDVTRVVVDVLFTGGLGVQVVSNAAGVADRSSKSKTGFEDESLSQGGRTAEQQNGAKELGIGRSEGESTGGA
ncbi:uncharacterized protein SPSK_04687 [Sporothrix schenckii 1099-18]|uniref:Uncharacterized protein n=1 Tax=Sporothrix schenckii 1099-18 TaxID=1397361 RepID=A0A0F2M0L6_SPOSC|nr:uncharacterized protein SPSK_04687 [Sporothrix schenckii 1099-18]KJR83258.1 hypothetical protein SPSK_04687 [Sporothrix schenckii 1099-18]